MRTFIWGSEESGHRHLYLYRVRLAGSYTLGICKDDRYYIPFSNHVLNLAFMALHLLRKTSVFDFVFKLIFFYPCYSHAFTN